MQTEQAPPFDVLLNNYMFDLLDESEWNHVVSEFPRVLQRGGFSAHLREYHQQMLFPSEVILATKESAS